jgi:hypothetical protein
MSEEAEAYLSFHCGMGVAHFARRNTRSRDRALTMAKLLMTAFLTYPQTSKQCWADSFLSKIMASSSTRRPSVGTTKRESADVARGKPRDVSSPSRIRGLLVSLWPGLQTGLTWH